MDTTFFGHTYEALVRMDGAEVSLRQTRARRLLAELVPEATGMLVFSRINIYYLTGTLGAGVLWLPRDGEGVLMLRKGAERARMESPVAHIESFVSYKELPALARKGGVPLVGTVAVEKSGLTWSMADMFAARVPLEKIVNADAVLNRARMVKTPYELERLAEAGRRHALGVARLGRSIRQGMNEAEIARTCIRIFLELGHGGIQRMNAYGEEAFFGHVAANSSGNYPHYYNGPMGFRGLHPAQPCLGSSTIWERETPLTVDMGFAHQGYVTDKTQTYWAGPESSLSPVCRHAYAVCVEVHDRAASALKPGAIPSQIWRDTLNYIATTPFQEGFMGLGGNKVPFLGHGIGLAIDEQPVFARGFDDPLEAGMVVALEPKIGLPGLGMVGIENTFAITPTGSQNLSADSTSIIFVE